MISWISKKIFRFFISVSKYKKLQDRILSLEKTVARAEIISARQSELLAALAGVQNDLVTAMGDTLLYPSETEATYVQKFILTLPDDDDLIN
tara:strand:- start:13 stop:288 length:276 start_codon:yes stop_codon:yes gene_type:complete